MAIVVNSECCKETAELLKNALYNDNELKDAKIIINIGNSSATVEKQQQTLMINETEAIKKCVNKKVMLELLKGLTPKFYNLSKFDGKIKALFTILKNRQLVIRSNGYVYPSANWFKAIRCGYATLKEKNLEEYRIIVFRNKVIKSFLKIPNDVNDFSRKQSNCHFSEVENLKPQIKKVCEEAARRFNIDLCGVDVLINEKNEAKVLEVNSGMALRSKSIEALLNAIRKELYSYPRLLTSF